MSSSMPSPASPGDFEPGAPISVPGVALWSDSDNPARPGPAAPFDGLVATPSDRAMPTIGHIGRYALKAQLGSGGLGTVFTAHDPLLSRLIAVKTLNLEIKEEERESFNTLFINEARAAGGLSHPHIVTVFDAGISDNRAYIAMELLKGRDLRQLRQEGWRATPAQAALIVRRVADALAFAHSKGVIHRDIKPANIFMVGRAQPRVLDFGIARVTHRRESNDAMPGAGSPYYMAPEQVRRETADRRADVFSLGVVLYELLTDVKPFRGESLKEITNAVLSHEPPLANKVDPAVPKALAEIAARAMAKDPEQRFRSARSFARELRQWLDANPVAPEGQAQAAPPPVRRRRAPVAVAAVLGATALAAAIAWWQAAPKVALAGAAATPASVAVAARPAPAPAVVAPAPEPAVVAAPVISAAASSAVPVAAASEALAGPTMTQDSLVLATLGLPMAAAAAQPAPVQPPAAAAVASPVVANAAPGAARPGEGAAPPAATLPPGKESAKDKRAREAREREARSAAAATAVVVATGTVRIAISPWGEVEVDGAPSGAAPPLTELTLAEGRHQIVVRNGDFAPFVTSVNVTAGQVVSLRHKFGS